MVVEAACTDTTVFVFDVAGSEVADLRLAGATTDEYTSLIEDEEVAFTSDEEVAFTFDEEATFMVDEEITDKTGAAEPARVVVLPKTPNSAFLQDPGEHLR